eukprot:3261394-Prymnesium_polylepis.1
MEMDMVTWTWTWSHGDGHGHMEMKMEMQMEIEMGSHWSHGSHGSHGHGHGDGVTWGSRGDHVGRSRGRRSHAPRSWRASLELPVDGRPSSPPVAAAAVEDGRGSETRRGGRPGF